MNFMKIFIPAFFSCCCNAFANMFWKIQFNRKPLSVTSFPDFISTVFSWRILIGMCFYGISMLLFFYMLSNYKLSTIIPLTCMTYVLNIIVGVFVFHETISVNQLIGIGIVIVGLIVLSRAIIT